MMLSSACEAAAPAPPTIDWSKPLRLIATGSAVKVEHECSFSTNRLVSWVASNGGACRAFVNRFGYGIATLHGGMMRAAGQNPFVENVPEEPKDHIILFKNRRGQYSVLGEPLTVSSAREFADCTSLEAGSVAHVMKVPV